MTPASALAWLRSHPRTAEALACVLCVALGWAWHRPSAPAVQYRDRVETKVEYRDRIVEKVVTVEAKATDSQRVTHRVETTHPDGTKVVELDTGTSVQALVNVQSLAAVNIQEQGATTATRETTLVQTPAPAPRFRLGALAGLSGKGPEYGAEASLRVLGPLWLGAWAITSPAAGVSLSVEW